ncbi:tetratricopeptide repeat protein [Azospirillum doebereinerae]|nr:tetratricopeptide repeat protein [Azospirillum doebereinerae]
MMRLAVPLLGALMVVPLVAAPVALAQSGPGGRALAPGVKVEVAPAPGSGTAPQPGTVDETALRYYARIGDVERLEAEIARLRALDPSWDPPKDLFAPQPVTSGVDESPFWTLVSAGKFAEARAAIAEQRRKTPSWQPSAKLLQELDLAEGSGRLRSASDTKRWQDVVDAAAAQPEAVACNRLDNAWRLAEAYAELKQTDRAFDTYKTVVSQCPSAKERRDTIFKASRYLSPAQLRELTALGATANPAPGEDYASVRAAEAELETGRLLERAGNAKGNLSATELAQVETTVRERRDADSAISLGWYFQSRKQYALAQSWFSEANGWTPSDRAAEGLILAYNGLGKKAEAREAGAPWRGTSSRVDQALKAVDPPRGSSGGARPGPQGPSELDRTLARRDFAGCLVAVQSAIAKGGKTAALVQQRGWCLLELKRPSEAEAAFVEAQALAAREPAPKTPAQNPSAAARAARDAATAGAITPPTATRAQENAYGQTVARMAAGDTVGVNRDLPRLNITAAQKAEIRASLLATEANRALEDMRYRDALRLLDARKELETEPRNLSILRGWALYNLFRFDEAYKVFKGVDDRLSTEESREGVLTTWKTIYHDW